MVVVLKEYGNERDEEPEEERRGPRCPEAKTEREMKAQALFLLGVVVVTHYGYPLFASATDEPETWASWAFYILRGVEGVALFGLLLQVFQGTGLWPRIGVIACWLGMFEEAQTAICGVIVAPSTVVPLWSGLCVEQFGRAPYLIVMAAAIAYILTGGRHRERET